MQKFVFTLLFCLLMMPTQAQPLTRELRDYCQSLQAEFAQIDASRQETLQALAQYIRMQRQAGQVVNLTFICTHNSRRSQLGQVWAKIASLYVGFADAEVQTYSGGTSATACNPRTVAALQRAGVPVGVLSDNQNPENPTYEVRLGEGLQPFVLFSKRYDDAFNPQTAFGAVLVCSQADETCPIVRGAAARIYHGYEDPKRADGTAEEQATYDATCRLIAREVLYAFTLAAQTNE